MIIGLHTLPYLIILSVLNYPYIQSITAGTPELSQNTTVGNFTGNATKAMEAFGGPEDLAQAEGPSRFPLNARKIAMELTKISPTEIGQYPIVSLSPEDIRLALGLLNPNNLAKVLLNINQQDLVVLQEMLTNSTFNQILNKLPEANKTQVQDRLSVLPSSVSSVQ